jgi:hypothetical protein
LRKSSDPLGESLPARLPPGAPPHLIVVVDTEEEFDWGAPPDRAATSVRAMRHVGRAQAICDEFGIRPTYVIDYPVASQPEGRASLREIADSGRAAIGAHLHPWVSPPHDEPLSRANTFPGNLDRDLEAAKLDRLAAEIERGFGRRPTIYKAGRYGLGPNTAAILEEQGFAVDLSVSPAFDWSGEGGPDYSAAAPVPRFFGRARRLLEIPITSALLGFAGRRVFEAARRGPWLALRAPGLLARLGAADRLVLSPEGCTAREHVKLTRALLRRGVRTFTWSFHSPSLEPGHTPYVRTDADLRDFLDRFRRYFDFFFGELGGRASTPLELKDRLETAS